MHAITLQRKYIIKRKVRNSTREWEGTTDRLWALRWKTNPTKRWEYSWLKSEILEESRLYCIYYTIYTHSVSSRLFALPRVHTAFLWTPGYTTRAALSVDPRAWWCRRRLHARSDTPPGFVQTGNALGWRNASSCCAARHIHQWSGEAARRSKSERQEVR